MRKIMFAAVGSFVVWFTTPFIQGFLEGFTKASRDQKRQRQTATAIATYHHLRTN